MSVVETSAISRHGLADRVHRVRRHLEHAIEDETTAFEEAVAPIIGFNDWPQDGTSDFSSPVPAVVLSDAR